MIQGKKKRGNRKNSRPSSQIGLLERHLFRNNKGEKKISMEKKMANKGEGRRMVTEWDLFPLII